MKRAALVLAATPLLTLPAYTQALPARPQPGHWEGALELPSGKLDLFVDLWRKGDAWEGTITIPAQGLKDFALTEVSATDGHLRFKLPGIPGEPHFEGVFSADGAGVNGTFVQGSARLPLAFRRTGEASAQAREAKKAQAPLSLRAGEREVRFAGFNAFPLNGTVLAGGAHPYFAVMVAGSGPTDRNWSNPLIPAPSHGGRDMAGWLQAQGIGSLRYDKRFIGAKDAHLDISLDAQLGDIKAALKAARALPEAKGKKLLLVGHGEGALLSLLAAGNADAVLLLAMPGMSMGKLILAQVKDRLESAGAPVDATKLNMDYLAAVLAAVRKDAPLPQADPGVAPGVVTLAKGLTQPESRTFVRDLLDLDPWGAAERLPVPCAVVWGDRDIQTWKPEVLPPDFKGTIIQIPEANHLFKRETRSRADLDGQAATTTYGDSTPMADLTPVGVWLKQLK